MRENFGLAASSRKSYFLPLPGGMKPMGRFGRWRLHELLQNVEHHLKANSLILVIEIKRPKK